MEKFATHLAQTVLQESSDLLLHPNSPYIVVCKNLQKQSFFLDLRPVLLPLAPVTAASFFTHVKTISDLIHAYQNARQSMPFEEDIIGQKHAHHFSTKFIKQIFETALTQFSDDQAIQIANWVKNLDLYTAVKSVESLLNGPVGLTLLKIADEKHWTIHFDHLAIRCGSASHDELKTIVNLLTHDHGYHLAQIPSEQFYQFEDGWSAIPLYKILENGQILRLFLDQSDSNSPKQIIQHWNYVYGFTSHHIAIHATQTVQSKKIAISIKDISQALSTKNILVMTPTGEYTYGLLEQVFARPEKVFNIPLEIKTKLNQIDLQLPTIIENGKLIEIVSRKEMSPVLAKKLFQLYGLEWDLNNPLHSAPYYFYFLPAQAAHVIKTSI